MGQKTGNIPLYGDVIPDRDGIRSIGKIDKRISKLYVREIVADTVTSTTGGGIAGVIAGAGLTGGGSGGSVTLNVGTGDGITVNADSISVNNTVVRTTRTLTAGAGLSGLGDLSSDRTIDVNVGNGIEIVSDNVSVKLATTSGLEFTSGALRIDLKSSSGLEMDSTGIAIADSIAGNGLSISSKVLNVVAADSTITVGANDIKVNQSFDFSWTGSHEWNQQTNHFGGIFVNSGQKIYIGDTYIDRLDGDTIRAEKYFRAERYGANTPPTATFHGKAPSALDTHLLILENTSGSANMQVEYDGTIWNKTGYYKSNVSAPTTTTAFTFETGFGYELAPTSTTNKTLWQVKDNNVTPYIRATRNNQFILTGEASGDSTPIDSVTIYGGKNYTGNPYIEPSILLKQTNDTYAHVKSTGIKVSGTGDNLYLTNAAAENAIVRIDTANNLMYLSGMNSFDYYEIKSESGVHFVNENNSNPTLTVRRRSGQTSDLIRWADESNNYLGKITKDGYVEMYRASVDTSGTYPAKLTTRSNDSTPAFRVEYDTGSYTTQEQTSAGIFRIRPKFSGQRSTIEFDAVNANPYLGYVTNLGSIQKKYLSLHAAELWVETLVAQDTIATIGGRILVGPTTTLTRPMASTDSTMFTKHNQMIQNDYVYMEANGHVEFMQIAGDAVKQPEGDYVYLVFRNLDGTGANDWYEGDAVFNTGQAGSGFIDLYSLQGVGIQTPEHIYNFDFSASSFSENYATVSNFSLFGVNGSTIAGNDSMYIGMENGKWQNLIFNLKQAAIFSGTTFAVQYWNGSTWTSLTWTSIPSQTSSTLFTSTGNLIIKFDAPASWAKTTINSVNAYWIRFLANSGGTWTQNPVQYSKRVYWGRNTYGPSIVFNVRNPEPVSATGFEYVNWSNYAAMGNLKGTYDYGTDTYGFAAGRYGDTHQYDGLTTSIGSRVFTGEYSWISADATNGIRIMKNDTKLAQWANDGSILVGRTGIGQNNVFINTSGEIHLRNNTDVKVRLSSAGEITVGLSTAHNVFIDSTKLTLRYDSTERVKLTATDLYIGVVGSEPYVNINNGAITFVDDTATNRVVISGIGVITLGDSSQNNTRITDAAIDMRQGSVSYLNLNNSAQVTIGRGIGTYNHAKITETSIQLNRGATTLLEIDSTPSITIGVPSSNNINITSTGLKIRYGTSGGDKIVMDSGGNMTMVGRLTITTGGDFLIGSTTTGIQMDTNGITGRNSSTTQVSISASTGKLTAGAGSVVLDSDGISVLSPSNTIYNAARSYKLKDNSGTNTYSTWWMATDVGSRSVTIDSVTSSAIGTETKILAKSSHTNASAIANLVAQDGTDSAYFSATASGTGTTSATISGDTVSISATTLSVSSNLFSITAGRIMNSIPLGCFVYHNTTQSCANNSTTSLVFNSELYDTDSMHSTSSNTGRIVVQTAGYYNVGASVQLGGWSATGSAVLTILVTDVSAPLTMAYSHSSRHVVNLNIPYLSTSSSMIYMDVGDYFTFQVTVNNAGGAVNCEAAPPYSKCSAWANRVV